MWTSFITAVIGGLVVLAADRVRWRREDRLRWVADRRACYGAFLAAVDRWDELDHLAALHGENEEWFDAPPTDYVDPALGIQTSPRIRPRAVEAAKAVASTFADLELLAPETVRRAAGELRSKMQELSWTRFDDPPRSCGGASGTVVAAEDALHAARDAFLSCARRDLGVESFAKRQQVAAGRNIVA